MDCDGRRGRHDRLARPLAADEAARRARPAGLGLDLDLDRDQAARPPRRRRLDRLRAGRRLVLLLAHGDGRRPARSTLDGRTLTVDGTAWFDHQWGDFISVGGGGWDWFAVNLDDGTDLTLSLVRDADGSYPLIYGTLVGADGTVRHLDRDAFSVEVTDHWTSPATGAATRPAGRSGIPGEDLTIDLRPTVADQELDTRATTGVVYWEGSQLVRATRDGVPIGGRGLRGADRLRGVGDRAP